MNKSELKRACVQNPLDMAEELDRLARLCEAKDQQITLLSGVFSREEELKAYLSQAQAQIAMLSEAMREVRTMVNNTGLSAKLIDDALSATSETVAAWRAKETEPLHREVAMLRALLEDISPQLRTSKLNTALSATQATASTYDREVTERARIDTLKEVKERISNNTSSAFDWIYKELRASNK